jgi:SAM-dependent methyltransferase
LAVDAGLKVEPIAPGEGFGAEHGEVGDPLGKRALMRLMPGARRQALLGSIRSVRYRGDAVECPCCDSTFSRFLPHRGRTQAKCPGCGALERHRALWLYLTRETSLLGRPGALLHIAPEYTLRRRFRQIPGLHYVTGDIDSPLADHTIDVMDLPFGDGTFDFLICNHVLEHVEDDRRALSEIHRVLRSGGLAILMCPVDHRRATTLEDPTARSPEERHRVFGQSDHRRLYGRDYPQRIAASGLEVSEIEYVSAFGEATVRRLGLRREEDAAFGSEPIYVGRRAN